MHIVIGDTKSRIEIWIVQIEHIAQSAITELEPQIAKSWKRVRSAGARRHRLEALAKASGLPKDVAACERALRDEGRALERAQPDAWFAARHALMHIQCVRRALAEGSAEEAAEAAFQATNAAWRVTGERIDPFVTAGIKARHAAARGGRTRAAHRRGEWDRKAGAIRERHRQMVATREKGAYEIRAALMQGFGVSRRTVARALRTRTKQTSDSVSIVGAGQLDDSMTDECSSQARKGYEAP